MCPNPCPFCGRMTQGFTTYQDGDPMIQALLARYGKATVEENANWMQTPIQMENPLPGAGDNQGVSGNPLPGVGDNQGVFGNPLPGMGSVPVSAPPPGTIAATCGQSQTDRQPNTSNKIGQYVLVAIDNSYEIPIPPEGGIVGRIELGAEQLAHNSAVSKQHLKVIIKKRLGVFVEDISTFGTFVNGEEIIKGDQVRVSVGSRITLYNEELILQQR